MSGDQSQRFYMPFLSFPPLSALYVASCRVLSIASEPFLLPCLPVSYPHFKLKIVCVAPK